MLPIRAQSRRTRPLPRHPARHATKGMAGLLARGSVQLAAFPTCHMRTEISGIRQALAAYSCGGSRGLASSALEELDVYHIPSSLSRLREAIKVCSTTLRAHNVNGDLASAGAASARRPRGGLTIVVAGPMHYAPRSCQVLGPTEWGWRVKRESGESASVASNPELPPQR